MNIRKYGCFCRAPFQQVMPVQDGWNPNQHNSRMPRMIPTPFRMAQTCQFSLTELGKVDPLCMGCSQKEANDVA